jgi:hypothetical protein
MTHPVVERERAILARPVIPETKIHYAVHQPEAITEMTKQPSVTPEMTAEQQRPWDEWMDTRINAAMERLATALGEEAADITNSLTTELRSLEEQITSLKCEISYLRGRQDAEPLDLPAVLSSRKLLNG